MILRQSVLGLKWEPFRIKRQHREKKLAEVLSKKEIENIILYTTNIKHKALISLAYSSGMRREKVRNLLITEIDPAEMRIKDQAAGLLFAIRCRDIFACF